MVHIAGVRQLRWHRSVDSPGSARGGATATAEVPAAARGAERPDAGQEAGERGPARAGEQGPGAADDRAARHRARARPTCRGVFAAAPRLGRQATGRVQHAWALAVGEGVAVSTVSSPMFLSRSFLAIRNERADSSASPKWCNTLPSPQ